jgi:hypothetical protein
MMSQSWEVRKSDRNKYDYLHGRVANHIWFTWESLCDGIEHHKHLGREQ